MKKYFFLIVWIVCGTSLLAQKPTGWKQDDSYILPYNKYFSSENLYYWQRTKPYPDYWQQDVHYRILANLKPDQHAIEGKLTLFYRNNAPVNLKELYFHLYQNAFTRNSYYDKKNRQKGIVYDYGLKGNVGEATVISSVRNNNKNVKYTTDNTLMRVQLLDSVKSGEMTQIDIEFTTYFSESNSPDKRMKMLDEKVMREDGSIYKVKHYDGTHWYPRVAVYDKKFSWCLDQHLGNEFYGDFGSYDVHITTPAYYILEATGVLQNAADAMPESLKRQIDLSLFADKKLNEPAKELFPPDNNLTKLWVFHATNVHDFAFTADPTYRREEVKLGDITCISMARERKAAVWQDAAEYAAKFVNYYNDSIGKYIYPKMVVADADDGMEYPMLTLDGGESPEYYSLLAHEIGHNWFYGMVGNNETYRAFLDEGFTQFYEIEAMESIVGKYDPAFLKENKRQPKLPIRYTEAYGLYIEDALNGDDGVLNTHSDDFGSKGNSPKYEQVYTKTATMLYHLKFVLGDQEFENAMRYYFDKWKIKHPYPEDFKNAISEYVRQDLNWFFDQWLDSDRKIDYKVVSVRPQADKFTHITFEKKGNMDMPFDFMVITKDNKYVRYYAPNSEFVKSVDSSTHILKKWYRIGDLNRQYTVRVPYGVKDVIIDPDKHLADINRLNNHRKFPLKVKPQWINRKTTYGNWEHYLVNVRPSIWWNGFSGALPGFRLEGAYMNKFHHLNLGFWYGTGLGALPSPITQLQVYKNDFQRYNYSFQYDTYLPTISKNTTLDIVSNYRDGFHKHGGKLNIQLSKSASESVTYTRVYAGYTLLYRTEGANNDYQVLPYYWTSNKTNSFLELGIERNFQYKKGVGNLRADIRTVTPGGQSNYAFVSTETKQHLTLGKTDIHFRAFGRYGTGNTPWESSLYLANASPEEMLNNAFFRARGFFPTDWILTPSGATGHVQYSGGLNLRGFSGCTPQDSDGEPDWIGSSGAAINLEWDFNRLIAHPQEDFQFRTYLFYDGGILGKNVVASNRIFDPIEWQKWSQDAGIGTAFIIGKKTLTHPITVRGDFPFYVNQPGGGEEKLAFRWLLGVNALF